MFYNMQDLALNHFRFVFNYSREEVYVIFHERVNGYFEPSIVNNLINYLIKKNV